jgi:ankyrin repeat protein
LLENRADPNKSCCKDRTALHFACQDPNNHPVVVALLKGGASVLVDKGVLAQCRHYA